MPQIRLEHDASKHTTVVDVLTGYRDDLDGDAFEGMSLRQLFELVERLTDFYAAWCPAPPPTDEIRISLATPELLRPALLYSDAVVIEDPIFEWLTDSVGRLLVEARDFNRGRVEEVPHAYRSELAGGVSLLSRWRPLIERGWVIPVPQRPERFFEFRALLRSRERSPRLYIDWHDLLVEAASGVKLTATEEMILFAGLARDQAREEGEHDPELWRAMRSHSDAGVGDVGALAMLYIDIYHRAFSAQARPLATHPQEWEYLLHRLRVTGHALRKTEKLELSVIPGLAACQLPFVSAVAPKTLLEIRANEEAFDAWQSSLRKAMRTVETLPMDAEFEAEARAVLDDLLVPAAAAVERATSRSAVLRQTMREKSLSLGLGGVSGLAVTQFGVPINYAAGSAGLAALIELTIRAILRPSASISHAVVARLLRG